MFGSREFITIFRVAPKSICEPLFYMLASFQAAVKTCLSYVTK